MDFIEDVKKKVAGDLEDFLLADEGAELVLEGAVHSVRDMGLSCRRFGRGILLGFPGR